MAKYQREFLVSYFRDVSALHLALHKLQEQLAALERRKCALEKGIHRIEYPKSPRYEAANGVFALGMGVYSFIFSCSLFVLDLILLGCFCMLGGVLILTIGVIRYTKVTKENTQKEERHNQKLAAYQQLQRKNDDERKAIPGIVDEIRACEIEVQRVRDTLRSVYHANVVPKHDQNMHTAIFLYIWFEAGKPNNLDMARNPLTDGEIRKKLDRFIASQGESILQQYLKQTPALQEKRVAMMEHKLNQIEASDEERNTYLAMIECNTATAAYFATAKYIGLP